MSISAEQTHSQFPCVLGWPVLRLLGKFQIRFFDIAGNMVIDLSDYDTRDISYTSEFGINAPCFENGQAAILFTSNAGSVFKAVIDKTGAFVGEPEKVGDSVH